MYVLGRTVLFFYLRIFHEEELHYVASMYDTIRTFGFGLADPSALRGVLLLEEVVLTTRMT